MGIAFKGRGAGPPIVSPRIAVVGAGFGGLAAVIELKRRGFEDIVVLEKAEDVGGVWRENTYPGAACDVPSPFYSYSFEPNPRWPHRFSRQPAILDYIRGVADKYDVRRHIRFGTEVVGATFDDATGTWTVEISSGEPMVVDVLVSAVGQLSRPAYPDIAGRDSFAGEEFHSATWDHDVDLTGKRVAVVGTGASAVQFVPEVREHAEHLTVFQRSAPYILPRPDRQFGPLHHRLFEKLPVTELAERATWYGLVEGLSVAWVHAKPLAAAIRAASRWHMRRQTKAEPGLFEKVWPDYPIGCKRVLFSDSYLPALAEPDVDLVTEGIERITPGGVLTTDGVEHPADVIIWGTGFKVQEFLAPMSITGPAGRGLHEAWRDGPHAYYGMTVPRFPNLFLMYGPNTNTGGGSIIYFLETQARYLGDYVAHLVSVGRPLAVRPEVEAAYDDRIQAELGGSVWSRCSSWYRRADGRITANWPFLGVQYNRQARFDAADYEEVGSWVRDTTGSRR
ncbi:flavin-containing monooxygenase [Luteipulveratus flavus]|uniref:NAD(P)/FAD-dependent oxidoreductase n=1 Tax=Luteipulveratus flavus TaxID=3031728 RepID=A0ABT6C211_9MICO|nr:NAD(P)/FAD-dependent oxidoreductase [Luteipulveratus sp. YIM 133296]MDF8262690.1 NAD(P)/FAD-dependent oxidoreductase [Luteipulveratus sp. YIM 133296]